MKIKTFSSWSERSLDKKLNEFLSDTSAEIIDIKFSSNILTLYGMVIYKEKIHGN